MPRLGAVVLACAALAVRAEDAPLRSAGVQITLRGDAVREDLLVPLTFGGGGFRVAGFFRGSLGPGQLLARASFGFAPIFDRFGDLAATLDYGLDAAWLLPASAHFSLGPMFAWETRINYLYRWDDAHAYWLGTQWLGLAARFSTPLSSEWRLEVAGSMALLGFEGRPPAYRLIKQEGVDRVAYYFSAPLQSESFSTPATLQAFRLDVSLRRALGWSLGLETSFTRAPLPAPNFNLSVGLSASRA